jgi:hypothetical protein
MKVLCCAVGVRGRAATAPTVIGPLALSQIRETIAVIIDLP